jgi:hypothetical protein
VEEGWRRVEVSEGLGGVSLKIVSGPVSGGRLFRNATRPCCDEEGRRLDDRAPQVWRKEYRVGSVEDLAKMGTEELEEQANIILYGNPYIIEEAMEREIFRFRIYIPSGRPIVRSTLKCNYRPWQRKFFCVRCGEPRSSGSGGLCLFCYRLCAAKRYLERVEMAEYWERQARGVAMPDTEWWDDSDLPARPTPRAVVSWGVTFRGDRGLDKVQSGLFRSRG